MTTVTAYTRRGLERQGFVGLDDARVAALNLPLRFTPALCSIAVITGVVLRSPVVLGLLAVSAVAAAAGVPHPFDLIYNGAVRRLTGGAELPPNPRPRRFAFIMAVPVLTASAVAFGVGATGLGLLFGCLQLAGCLSYSVTGFCLGSWVHEKLFGAAGTRTARPCVRSRDG